MIEPHHPFAVAGEYIERALAEWNIVGATVAVVRGTEIIYAQGFGLRQLGKQSKLDQNTLFQVGSTTKAFTTAALGTLVDEGKIAWDDPVIRYLPDFQLRDPWITRHLTVRDILTHRSGIAGDVYPFLGLMGVDEATGHLRHAESVGAFRDSYVYSNLMYALAGKVIEVVSGSRWGPLIKCRLLEPLDMSCSGSSPYEFWESDYVTPTFLGTAPRGACSLEQARTTNLAMPHGWDEQGSTAVLPWQSYDCAAAAGALVSSASDMAKWLILQLNDGCYKGQRLLKQETIRELHALQNPRTDDPRMPSVRPPLPERSEGYAMGWFRGRYRGLVHLSHNGGILGFPAYAAFIPEAKLGVVVLANGPRFLCDQYAFNRAIGFWLFDEILGADSEHDWSGECFRWARSIRIATEARESELRGSRRDAPPSLSLPDYAGIYEDRIGQSGPVQVSVKDGGLRLSFRGAGAFSAKLEHWHYDLFRMHANPVIDEIFDGPAIQGRFVGFSLDPKGRINSMSAFGVPFLRHAD